MERGILNDAVSTTATAKAQKNGKKARKGAASRIAPEVLEAYRLWGYLEAALDPFGRMPPVRHPQLPLEGDGAEEARKIYCGSIGVEIAHIPDAERRDWIQERMEGEPAELDRKWLLERLIRAEVLEILLDRRYPGHKRFSIEGIASLVPLLDEVLEAAGGQGAEQAVLAMAHRGRLTVMVEVVGRDVSDIFTKFEDVDARSVLGGGDVKYHLGATGTYETRSGEEIQIHLASNPSHLEAVNPVVLGRVRAKQRRLGEDGWKRVLPVLMHGDAALAGQGITAETFNMADLRGYTVGGAVHVVVNNLIGFTAGPRDLHSSRFATDVAKRLPIPILHVNAEDPEAVLRAARMAADYRYAFRSDVVVDLIGFRRHGHSEVDDPTLTQPGLYKRIKETPPLWERYAEKLDTGRDEAKEFAEKVKEELDEAQERSKKAEKRPVLRTLPKYWDPYEGDRYDPKYEVESGIPRDRIRQIAETLVDLPDGFHLHPKLEKLMEQRLEMGKGERPIDYGTAEAFAFGSLLEEGFPVRLTGQDSRRATFNQRHAVLIDYETEEEIYPLAGLAKDGAFFEVYDSPLSEASVMAFDYGFSRDYPGALVLWEAQFGDFVNGAQIVIDQFLSSAEDKWDLLSGLVLLLPHGYEGQGPEHSSARLERFLQLAAEDNMIVCQPSTAAQYFHMLRRQALSSWRKPLIVMTPKSMLRSKASASPIEELERERFLRAVPDPEVESPDRILFASGKIGHELKAERDKREDDRTAIVFLDQLYPFPDSEVEEILEAHPEAELVWVQEEPANMGGLFFVQPRIQRLARGRRVRTVKRTESASPATGSANAHAVEQKTLLSVALARRGR